MDEPASRPVSLQSPGLAPDGPAFGTAVRADSGVEHRLFGLMRELDDREALEYTLDVVTDELQAAEIGSTTSHISSVLAILARYVGCDDFVTIRFFDETVEDIEVWSRDERGSWSADSGNAVRLSIDMLPALAAAFRNERPFVADDVSLLQESEAERWFFEALGAKSAAALPVYSLTKLRGALLAIDRGGSRAWDEQDVTLIGTVARYVTHIYAKRSSMHDLNRSRIMFEHLSATSDNGVWLSDPSGRTLLLNANAAQWLSVSEAAAQGARPTDLACFVPRDAEALLSAMIAGRQRTVRVCSVSGKSTQWLDVTVIPLSDEAGAFDGAMSLLVNVTERVLAERRELDGARLDRLVSEMRRCIDRARSPREFARDVCRIIVDRAGYQNAWIGLHDRDSEMLEAYESHGEHPSYVDMVLSALRARPDLREKTYSMLRNRQTVVYDRLAYLEGATSVKAEELGIRSLALFPLVLTGGVVGFLLVSASSIDAFGDKALEVLEGISADFVLVHDGLSHRARRREAERARDEVSRLLAAIVEAVPVGILSVDTEGCVSSWNSFAERTTGICAEGVLGRPMPQLFSRLSEQPACALITHVLGGAEISDLDAPIGFRSGKRIIARTWASPLRSPQGRVTGAVVLFADMTSERTMERKTAQQQRRLRQVTAEMGIALDRERRQIAMGLHDTVGQNLAALTVVLGMLGRACESVGAAEQHARAMSLLSETIRETRSFTFEISPPILDERGLGPAMEWLTERYSSEWPGEWTYSGSDIPLAQEQAAILYRSARELLGNAARHSQAEHITVGLRRDTREVKLSISDDGIGMNEDAGAGQYSLGLFGIREQLGRLGARLEIRSEWGVGTTATVSLPM